VRDSVSADRGAEVGEEVGEGLKEARGVASEGVVAGFGVAVTRASEGVDSLTREPPRPVDLLLTLTVNGAVAR